MNKRYLLIVTLFLAGYNYLIAQTINGPTPVNIGTTQSYTFDNGIIYSNQAWSAGNNDYTSTRSGTTYTINVTWRTSGTNAIAFLQNYVPVASKNVVVNCTTPPTPNISSWNISTNTCGDKTVSYTPDPPTGFTWYWQSTSGGTSTTNSTKSYTIATTGQAYVRASCGSLWGTALSTGSVTVNVIPAAPATTITKTQNLCGPKTLGKGSGTPPANVSWFWQGMNATGTDATYNATTDYTATIDGGGTYYLRARSTPGCWSNTSISTVIAIDYPVAPNASTLSYCEWEAMPLTTTGYLTNLKWYNTSNTLLYTGTTYTPTGLLIGNYSYNVKNISFAGCESLASAPITLIVRNDCDDHLNWTEGIGYGLDAGGNSVELAHGKTYYNGVGDELQSQAKSYSSNQVLASQPLYDKYNSATGQTLAAPTNISSFIYKHRFVTNPSGQHYGPNDFDGSDYNIPLAVGNNEVGTLGWYYSSNNTTESYTPTTSWPYSRAYTPEGPNPVTSKLAGPGDLYKMGAGHESVTDKSKFIKSELSHYFQLRSYFVTTTQPSKLGPNLFSNPSVDPNANNLTGFTAYISALLSSVVQNNETYVKGVANQTGGTPGIRPIGGLMAVTPGSTYIFKVRGYASANNVSLSILNVTSGSPIITGASLPVGALNEGWVENTFTIPAGCTSLALGVLFGNPGSTDQFYINTISLQQVINDDNIPYGYKIIATDPDSKRMVSYTDIEGHTLATAFVRPDNSYDYWSYAFYNDIGQVVASVAPKGVIIGNGSYPNYVTLYSYDHLGRMIETSSIDEGTTQFVYSTDGKIRFSQDQVQRDASPKRFSYLNYDYLGRLVETGEYTSNDANTKVFQPHTATIIDPKSVLYLVEIDIPQGKNIETMTTTDFPAISQKFDNTRCTDYSFARYDDSTDLPASDSDTNHPSQKNLFGRVAKTYNANSTTWYSYDEFGRLLWTKHSITGLTGYKTIDYTYDFQSNVSQVIYQQNIAGQSAKTDILYHHYVYDADQRLSEVWTSKDGLTKTIHARYKYYLHGPLKRVELANTKQGIDYVYTIDGLIKSINHAEPSKDPGLDGISGDNASFTKDVFGMTMHYNDTDYTGAGHSAGSITLNSATYPSQYGGNLRAVTYNNRTDYSGLSSSNKKHVYAFKYDELNQLSDAQFGSIEGTSTFTPTFAEAQREQVPSYDKNGNIILLTRKGKDGQITGNYTYVYDGNSNRLDRITNTTGGTIKVDYTYNAVGQMTKQEEGDGSKILNVYYNVGGLVNEIRDGRAGKNNQLLLKYAYDMQGKLIKKTGYDSNGVEAKYTFYVPDASGNVIAIYEQSPVTASPVLIEQPVYGLGRVAIYKPQVSPPTGRFFYEVTDHLGNVRAVIGSPITVSVTATMESENACTEEDIFKGLSNVRVPGSMVTSNHTPNGGSASCGGVVTGDEVAKLNNQKPAGPTYNIAVSPGDVINLDVWSYYTGGISTSPLANNVMIAAIAAAFGGVPGDPGEAGRIYNNINGFFGDGSKFPDNSTLPLAFMEYIVYDRNYQMQFWGSRAVSAPNVKEHLVADPITIDQPGYIYICLYNRSDDINPVYFDDLTVSITHSDIVAGADYYPFGLVMDGMEITDESYRYGYQGQFSEKDPINGWNQFELRNYDPRFGRWNSADPYGQYASPYVGMGNNPFSFVDPDGGFTSGPRYPRYSHSHNSTGGGGGWGFLIGVAIDAMSLYYSEPGILKDIYTDTKKLVVATYDATGTFYGGTKALYNRLTGGSVQPWTFSSKGPVRFGTPESSNITAQSVQVGGDAVISAAEGEITFGLLRGGKFVVGKILRRSAPVVVSLVKAELKFTQKQLWKKFGEHFEEFGLEHGKVGLQKYLEIAEDILNNPVIKHTFKGSKYAGETWYIKNRMLLRVDSEGLFKSLYYLK
jgi:RHS repeat-associated protein